MVVLLLIFGFTTPLPLPAEQGILVNFGSDETGSGLIEPSAPSTELTAAPEETSPVFQEKTTDQILTQEVDKEAPVVKKQEDIDAERKIQEQLEADKKIKEQEELEKKRVADEQKRLNDIMTRTKNALVSAKNTGTSSTGEGITGGQGNQGVVTGSVNSNVRGNGSGLGTSGISYSLSGRGSTSLPKPKYDYQGEGIVVVEVTVDRAGNVIKADAGIKGSTTLDDYFLKVSKEAAMLAKFEVKPDAPAIQKGTITYNFILK
jgi:colicin import membrane protein